MDEVKKQKILEAERLLFKNPTSDIALSRLIRALGLTVDSETQLFDTYEVTINNRHYTFMYVINGWSLSTGPSNQRTIAEPINS